MKLLSNKYLYNKNNNYTKLKELANLKNGYAFKSSNYSEIGNFKVITIGNVKGDKYIFTDEINLINNIPSDIKKHQILKPNDILVSMTGNVGRVSMVNCNNCLLNQRVGLISIKNIEYKDLIYYALSNKKFENSMINKAQGAAQLNVSKNDIESFLVPININNNILKLLSSIDYKIEIENKYLNLYKKYKQYLLNNLFI